MDDDNIDIENIHAYMQFSKSFRIYRYTRILCILQRSQKSLTKSASTVAIFPQNFVLNSVIAITEFYYNFLNLSIEKKIVHISR